MPETRVQARSHLPLVFDAAIQCPAGLPIGETLKGSGCVCRIEDSELLSASDPSSLQRFCLNDYQDCPTWQAEKDWIHKMRDRKRRLIDVA